MTTPFYAQGGGTTPVGSVPIIPVVAPFSPSSTDVTGVNGPFKLGQTWVDTSSSSHYTLVNLTITSGFISAIWQASATAGALNTLSGDVGIAVPTAGDIKIAGGAGISTSAAGSTVTITATNSNNVVTDFVTNIAGPVTPLAGSVLVNASTTTFTDGTVANTLKTEVQSPAHTILIGGGTDTLSTPLSPSVASGIPIISQGVASNPIYGTALVPGGGTGDTSFTPYTVICAGTTSTGNLQNVVDVGTTGQVLTSNGAAALPTWQDTSLNLSINVDASTPPGTDPVVPNGSGQITLTAGQVPAGTTGAQCLRTDSLAANAITVQVQRSAAVGASAVASNGVSHFNSADFSVDANGFVSMLSPGGTGITKVAIQTFTASGTYTPTTGMKYCIVELVGGGGAGGGAPSTGGVNTTTYFAPGGGAGEYARAVFSAAQIGVSQAVTIGTAGIGSAGAIGGSGGTTSLGTLISSGGGSGGPVAIMNSEYILGGAGGTGGGGTPGSAFRNKGQSGGPFYTFSGPLNSYSGLSGIGASSIYGSGAEAAIITQTNTTVPGNAATGYGAGGSGAITAGTAGNANTAGGNGSSGIVVITEYI